MNEEKRQAELIASIEKSERDSSEKRAAELTSIAKVAVGAVPVTSLLWDAIKSGDYSLLSGAMIGGGMFVMKSAWDIVKEKRQREPQIDKNGPGLAIDIAIKASGKSEFMRRVWIGLLSNAIDPAFDQEIRKSDLLLLDNLHTSDAALLLMVGKRMTFMRKDWEDKMDGANSILNVLSRKPNDQYPINKITNFSALRISFKEMIKAELKVSDNDLFHSITVNSLDHNIGPRDSDLFDLHFRFSNGYIRKINGQETIEMANMEASRGLFAISLLPRAERLLELVYDRNWGW